MSCNGTADCTCGCCAGAERLTPQRQDNLPGLQTISFRVGAWSSFKKSMLARLSSADYPALRALRTRNDDDFTIAFLDAAAVVLDILTFYQERIANESYLRTATQLRSLMELSQLIGYQPSPGVAASAYLAFSFKQTPGQPPDSGAAPIVVPKGTKVQSVPAQGQTPQTFETITDTLAKADWSALPVQTGAPWDPASESVYLNGASTQLQLGDSILILGIERERFDPASASAPSEQWDVAVINKMVIDKARNLTYVAWDKRLTHGSLKSSNPSEWTATKVFAFRQKAALFGHNAPSPYLFVNPNSLYPSSTATPTTLPNLIDTSGAAWQWRDFQIQGSSQVDLDSTYSKITDGSWFALTLEGVAQLYKVKKATAVSVAKFAMSGKVTELEADFPDPEISAFDLRLTGVWAQSDELEVAEQPLPYPLYGAIVQLQNLRTDMADVQVIALFGARQKIAVKDGLTSLQFSPGDGSAARALSPREVLTLTAPPSPLPVNPDGKPLPWDKLAGERTLYVQDANGRAGTVIAELNNFDLAPSGKNDAVVSEYAFVGGIEASDPKHTKLLLTRPLAFCYDRATTAVNANTGLATHGQSVTEILGNGDASARNQSFTLKQKPLTYVQAPTPSGGESTLEVRVSGVKWQAAPSLYKQMPAARVFTTRNQAGGGAEVLFGDGIEGSLLPSGQSNIHASYRAGLGSAGNVGAGALTSLIDRPLGVSGVTNPEAATGGQDPEPISGIRTNAPRTVLTLGRAVSITDYENFARGFAGIAKAHALWIQNGPGRGVFLTVAGARGAALPAGNPTLAKLSAALKAFGNPLVPISLQTFVETLFSFSATIHYDPDYDQKSVETEIRQALSQSFSFAARDFGEAVGIDEVAAVIQSVPGVLAVNVKGLTRGNSSTGGDLAGLGGSATSAALDNWLAKQVKIKEPFANTPFRLCAYLPVADPKSMPQPAEILVIDPDPAMVVLGAMP